MMVEVIGLPGVGKSTMVRKFGELGKVCVIQTPLKWLMLREALVSVVRHPRLAASLLFYWFRYGESHTRYYLFMNAVLLKLAKFVIAQRVHDAVVAEGLVQNMLSFWHRPMSVEDVERDMASLPMPDVVVVLEGENNFHQSSGAQARMMLGQSIDEWHVVLKHNLAIVLEVLKKKRVDVRYVTRDTGVEVLERLFV